MIRFRLKELIAEKEFREQRKITLIEVAEKTGVNRTSLSKMQNPANRHSTHPFSPFEILFLYPSNASEISE